MKRFVGLALSAVLFASTAMAADFKSGPEAGKRLGAFDVVKCAGAEDDSVEVGKKLCYRCKNGSRPQVIVFTKSTGEEVTKLAKLLDTHVKKFEEEQLRAFVNVLGESKDAADAQAKKLAKAAKTEMIPFVVPVEFANGPENYGLNPKAEVTIVIANESKIVSSFGFKSAEKLDAEAITKTVKKMLN